LWERLLSLEKALLIMTRPLRGSKYMTQEGEGGKTGCGSATPEIQEKEEKPGV
jgi:hypothetical protein